MSGNPASLTAGDLKLAPLGRIVSGIARNVEAEDRFGAWTMADHAVRGARRISLYGLKRTIADLSEKISRLCGDQSSDGLQATADYFAELKRVTRVLAGEIIVAGLADDTVVS